LLRVKAAYVSHTTTLGVTNCTTSCLIGPLRVCQSGYVVVLTVVSLILRFLQATKLVIISYPGHIKLFINA